jgi:hypothetical protein
MEIGTEFLSIYMSLVLPFKKGYADFIEMSVCVYTDCFWSKVSLKLLSEDKSVN